MQGRKVIVALLDYEGTEREAECYGVQGVWLVVDGEGG